jgi:hypothetical protein
MITDLERAYAALSGKQALYQMLWNYYNGDQPVVYTNQRLKDLFQGVDARFTENWCAVVVDAVHERLELKVPLVEDQAAQDALDGIWADQDLGIESDDAHQAALVCGEAFFIVWKGEDETAQAYYNDPRLCHVFYDAENPHQVAWAAKWWDAEDGTRRLTLYYPDRLEYYVSRVKKENVSSAKAFIPWPEEESAPNPFGEVPVFHFRTGRRPTSEMTNAISLQNGVNKLLIDMMVASEFGAFKQKYVISNADNLGQLKNAANEIWLIPAGDGVGQAAAVGEFNATELGNYLGAIDNLSNAIGVITRTPRHYFFSQGGDPSGEALIAMEAPLNKKVKRRIERFSATWRRAFAFLLTVSGYPTEPDEVTVEFERPETVQPLTQAQVRQFEVAAGIPLHTSLRREGWSDAELEQLDEDAAAATVTGEQLGDRLLGAFDRGQ